METTRIFFQMQLSLTSFGFSPQESMITTAIFCSLLLTIDVSSQAYQRPLGQGRQVYARSLAGVHQRNQAMPLIWTGSTQLCRREHCLYQTNINKD